jgi:hypothetical protein
MVKAHPANKLCCSLLRVRRWLAALLSCGRRGQHPAPLALLGVIVPGGVASCVGYSLLAACDLLNSFFRKVVLLPGTVASVCGAPRRRFVVAPPEEVAADELACTKKVNELRSSSAMMECNLGRTTSCTVSSIAIRTLLPLMRQHAMIL